MKKFVEIGKKYRWNRSGVSNTIIYTLVEVEGHIVFKWYSYVKKYWRYQLESRWALDYWAESGRLTKIKGRK